jgi:hypothetical protein
VPIQSDHRERALTLLEASALQLHRVTDGRTVDDCDVSVAERAVEIVMRGRRPLEGFNNPLSGRGLYVQTLTVRVAYLVTGGGFNVFEGAGAQSGSATNDAAEDRAAADAHVIETLLGLQAPWAGLDPSVIECAPSPDGSSTETLDDRLILSVPLELTTRAALPGAYGPTTP